MRHLLLTALLLGISILSYSAEQQSILKNPASFKNLLARDNVWGKKILLGYSKKNKPVYAYYYNRGGTDKAMIIGGVHGSEFYGVDVANALKDSLDKMKVSRFKWKILVIPELFPDNVEEGRNNIFEINWGRKTCEKCHGMSDDCKCIDPNRQMPKSNMPYKIGDSLSCTNEKIETENQYLLFVTQLYNPSRIVSLHCKNAFLKNQIGIYADPRVDKDNIALGFSEDAILALKMAFIVKENEGVVYGNFVDEKYVKNDKDEYKIKAVSYLNPVYPKDPPAESKGSKQDRTYETNGGMVSYGTWASTEIRMNNKLFKKAATILTIELPQYYSFFETKNDMSSLKEKELYLNTTAYVKAIKEVFLEAK